MDANVPSPIPNVTFGIYAIVLRQMEMYDLGNIDAITHYYLYDRTEDVGSRMLVDVTHEVKDAPLLSRMGKVSVNSPRDIDIIESFLIGEEKVQPYESGEATHGIVGFEVRELPGAELVGLRKKMQQLVATHYAHEQAIDDLKDEMGMLRGVLQLPEPRGAEPG